MEPIEIINRLSAIPGRGPGTDAERRAAKMLAQVLHDGGREAELDEPVPGFFDEAATQSLVVDHRLRDSDAGLDVYGPSFGTT